MNGGAPRAATGSAGDQPMLHDGQQEAGRGTVHGLLNEGGPLWSGLSPQPGRVQEATGVALRRARASLANRDSKSSLDHDL